jgi:hypothetical protein
MEEPAEEIPQDTTSEEPATELAALDLDELARKVVELLLRELLLENERTGKY